MVSVLMPVYNAVATLPQAVASVRRQSYRAWELVAVDDGSSDDSGAVLDQMAAEEPRLRVLHLPHQGLVPALNAGLESCRGDWLARFDADDLMHRDRLHLQRRAAFAGVLGCGVRCFPMAAIQEGFARYELWLNSLRTHAEIERDLFVESPLAHPSVMLPTGLLRGVGGYRDCGWPEDYDLWFRLWRAGTKFAKLPEVLHYWRDHPGRLTRSGEAYRRAAFRECKLEHLLATRLRGRQRLVLWGAGEGGKVWSRLLERAGKEIAWLIDIDPAKIGGRLRGAPVRGASSLADRRDELVLVTVGVRGARELIRAALNEAGLRETDDYVCLA
ncbi:MAG: glycosyltransferase [Armatimonadetes bacterium]|nr:glycosyltransferase [Armatimonadota bacterium]